MALTYRGSLVSTAIKDFVVSKQGTLGIRAVYYGDQRVFPTTPAVCVEPAITTRELSGIPYQTDNNFTVNVLVYHTSSNGTESIQEACDTLSELLQDELNKESIAVQFAGGTQFGGIIISGHTSRLEYGYKILGDQLMRCNRLVWSGFTKTRLVE
jgi:hypothetical protein